jgi:hypothetical protein
MRRSSLRLNATPLPIIEASSGGRCVPPIETMQPLGSPSRVYAYALASIREWNADRVSVPLFNASKKKPAYSLM